MGRVERGDRRGSDRESGEGPAFGSFWKREWFFRDRGFEDGANNSSFEQASSALGGGTNGGGSFIFVAVTTKCHLPS